jgi:hypothetical protein
MANNTPYLRFVVDDKNEVAAHVGKLTTPLLPAVESSSHEDGVSSHSAWLSALILTK